MRSRSSAIGRFAFLACTVGLSACSVASVRPFGAEAPPSAGDAGRLPQNHGSPPLQQSWDDLEPGVGDNAHPDTFNLDPNPRSWGAVARLRPTTVSNAAVTSRDGGANRETTPYGSRPEAVSYDQDWRAFDARTASKLCLDSLISNIPGNFCTGRDIKVSGIDRLASVLYAPPETGRIGATGSVRQERASGPWAVSRQRRRLSQLTSLDSSGFRPGVRHRGEQRVVEPLDPSITAALGP